MSNVEAEPQVIDQTSMEHSQPFSRESPPGPQENLYPGPPPECPDPPTWDSTSPEPYRSWPGWYPALYNSAFVVRPSFVEHRTTLEIPSKSILWPVFRKKRIHMDEAYMILEYEIQKTPSRALEQIQFELAQMLRHEVFFVRNPDPQSGLKIDSIGLDRALWAKQKDLLARRAYLELCFHSFHRGAIRFPHDSPPRRTFALQTVLDSGNCEEVGLKVTEMGGDDAVEPRWAMRVLRKQDLVERNNSYVLVDSTYRHPDKFEGKFKVQKA